MLAIVDGRDCGVAPLVVYDSPALPLSFLPPGIHLLVPEFFGPIRRCLHNRFDTARLLLVELHVERRELFRRGLVDRFERGCIELEMPDGTALFIGVRGPLLDLALLLLLELFDSGGTLLYREQHHVQGFLRRLRLGLGRLDDAHRVLDPGARLVVLRALALLDGAHVEFLRRLLGFAPLLPLRRDSINFVV